MLESCIAFLHSWRFPGQKGPLGWTWVVSRETSRNGSSFTLIPFVSQECELTGARVQMSSWICNLLRSKYLNVTMCGSCISRLPELVHPPQRVSRTPLMGWLHLLLHPSTTGIAAMGFCRMCQLRFSQQAGSVPRRPDTGIHGRPMLQFSLRNQFGNSTTLVRRRTTNLKARGSGEPVGASP